MLGSVKTANLGIKQRLADKLLSSMRYLSADGQMFNFTAQGLIADPAAAATKSWVLVLSRQAYQEQTESFAIASASALTKVLKQRAAGKLQYHFISPLRDGQRRVLTIEPHEGLAKHCQQAYLVLPCSLLVAHKAQPGLTQVITPDGGFFTLKHPSQHWQSLSASALVPDCQSALQIMGGAADCQINQISGAGLVNYLQKALFSLPAAFWLAALQPGQRQGALRWRPILLSAAVIFASYLALSTGYLYYQLHQQQLVLQRVEGDIGRLLDLRQAVEQKQAVFSQLAEQNPPGDAAKALWSIVALLQQSDTVLTSMQSDMSVATLQGNAASAVEVLSALLAQPFIADAQFIAPVRRGPGGREVFTISVNLETGGGDAAE